MDADLADLAEIVAGLGEQHEELAGLLADVDDRDWDRPAPSCPGWSVSDVVLHLAQTDMLTVASLQGMFTEAADELVGSSISATSSADAAVELMVRRGRGSSGPVVFRRWLTGAVALRDRLGSAEEGHRRYEWANDAMSLRSLATTRLAEAWIHTGDVAEAVGHKQVPADRLRHIVRLAWRTLPYAFRQAGLTPPGPVAFELTGPAGDRWDFVPAESPRTVIRGDAFELCRVAGRRTRPADTGLHGDGPDADAVLRHIRTYA